MQPSINYSECFLDYFSFFRLRLAHPVPVAPNAVSDPQQYLVFWVVHPVCPRVLVFVVRQIGFEEAFVPEQFHILLIRGVFYAGRYRLVQLSRYSVLAVYPDAESGVEQSELGSPFCRSAPLWLSWSCLRCNNCLCVCNPYCLNYLVVSPPVLPVLMYMAPLGSFILTYPRLTFFMASYITLKALSFIKSSPLRLFALGPIFLSMYSKLFSRSKTSSVMYRYTFAFLSAFNISIYSFTTISDLPSLPAMSVIESSLAGRPFVFIILSTKLFRLLLPSSIILRRWSSVMSSIKSHLGII